MTDLTIAALAHASGVKRETIRYYEQRGLLAPPPRSAAGYRLYAPAEARRVQFIRSAQTLGFSLDEIAELLALRSKPDTTRRAVKARAAAKIADVDRKIASLSAMRTALAGIEAACDGGTGLLSACPILVALDHTETSR